MVCDVLVELRARRLNLSQSEEAAGMGFNVCSWSNTGARFHDLVTRKLTVALFQPMPGLEEPDRKRLLPVRVFSGSSNTDSSVQFLYRLHNFM
jgi:hypothetical protein